jgi:hypothetical protein
MFCVAVDSTGSLTGDCLPLPRPLCTQASFFAAPWGRKGAHSPSRTLSAMDYSTLHQASAPDLSRLVRGGSGHSSFGPARGGGALGGPRATLLAQLQQQHALGVQPSAGSASALLGGGSDRGGIGARAAARAVRRSPSMHERMMGLVLSAKERSLGHQQSAAARLARAPTAPGHADLVALRWAAAAPRQF